MMKNTQVFKEGDKVYCPSISSDILTIGRPISDITIFDVTHPEGKVRCGFVCHLHSSVIFRLDNGRCIKTHYQKVVQDTQKNYELLSKLYPDVAFEPPPENDEVVLEY